MQGVPRSRAVSLLFCLAAACAACSRKPASIDIAPRRVVLYGTGHPKDIMVRVLDRKGRELPDQPLAWTSSDASVVEGAGSGHITAKKPGRAKLTVSSGAASSTVPVEIVDISEISVQPSSLKLLGPPGTSAKLEVAGKSSSGGPVQVPSVGWSAENPKIVRVSADGFVTSIAPGKTAVAARLGDLFSQSEVQVENKVVSRLELRPETAILKVSDSQKFTAFAYDGKGLLMPDAGAQFASLNPDLVRISGEGKATALKKGTATVTATLGGKVAQAIVLIN